MNLKIIDRCISITFFFMACGLLIYGKSLNNGAGTLPVSISILSMISAFFVFKATFNLKTHQSFDLVCWERFFGYLLLSFLLVFGLEFMGAFVAIPIFLFLSFKVFGNISFKLSFAISVLFSIFIYIVFFRLLEVPLPNGILSGWLDV